MNWTEIKEKYPKAYDSLLEWEPIIDISVWIYFKDRNLYDFFDEQELIIEIGVEYGKDCEDYWFEWFINLKGTGGADYLGHKCYKSRSEAEQAAFTKAFEILEEKLKGDL